MRHRFHALCPYFAIFPESFAAHHLAASPHAGVVFDPFCGRGTTVFQALLQDRKSAGCDLNPVAACIAGAKCAAPERSEIEARLLALRKRYKKPTRMDYPSATFEEFFRLCYQADTLDQILYLRSALHWRTRKDDRFIAALCLGALHGESHRSANYFSNRMPRTISTKPAYSVRWWKDRGHVAQKRDVFEILDRMLNYRYKSDPPRRKGHIAETDVRQASRFFPDLRKQVTDIITSPPYLDTTNYREDQWLRRWFLGDVLAVPHDRGDDRHNSPTLYFQFLHEAWRGIEPLLADQARIVVRIGGRRLDKDQLQEGLMASLSNAVSSVHLTGEAVTTDIKKTQANSFRGSQPSRTVEHDFVFVRDIGTGRDLVVRG